MNLFRRINVFRQLSMSGIVSSRSLPSNCWKCSGCLDRGPHVVCKSCNSIQPLHPGMSYFDYFGLKNDFIVDANLLKKRFREIQTFVHPDKFTLHEDKEQRMADAHSSFANQGYKILNDPRARALYMLELSNTDESPSTDMEFAMEMLELNEEIESLTDAAELKKKQEEVDATINNLLEAIAKNFEAGDNNKARDDLDRLRYFDRTKKLIKKMLGN